MENEIEKDRDRCKHEGPCNDGDIRYGFNHVNVPSRQHCYKNDKPGVKNDCPFLVKNN